MKVQNVAKVLLAVLLSVGLCACSLFTNPKEDVKNTLDSEFGRLKNLTPDTIGEVVKDSDFSALSQYGIDVTSYVQSLFSGFDYKIDEDSIEIDGDSAKATVEVTLKDWAKLIQETQDEFLSADNASALQELYAQGGQDAIEKEMLDKLQEKINNSTDTVTKDCTLELSKVDGAWQIREDSLTAMYSTLFVSGEAQQ